jgi:hypothetical protein
MSTFYLDTTDPESAQIISDNELNLGLSCTTCSHVIEEADIPFTIRITTPSALQVFCDKEASNRSDFGLDYGDPFQGTLHSVPGVTGATCEERRAERVSARFATTVCVADRPETE